jgi:hypothetical protein
MPQLTGKKNRFCIVAGKNFMLSPAWRKKNIALLNLSSQCIAFMEKCISVPHDKENKFLLSFSWEKNNLTEEGSEKKITSIMKIPGPPR